MRIGFFGDSITEGCFEIVTINGKTEILRDKSACYATRLENALRHEYPETELSFFNAGLSGHAVEDGLGRIQSDVLDQNPDLVITCFGLNDVYYRDADVFAGRLGEVFRILRSRNIAVIYMTPNMLNRYVSPNTNEAVLETARDCADCQNTGVLDKYMDAARKKAAEYDIPVADAYAAWKQLDAYGIDTTQLLCNWINHPSRKMHALFSDTIQSCIREHQLIKTSVTAHAGR